MNKTVIGEVSKDKDTSLRFRRSDRLCKMLASAIAEEFTAYYQYVVPSRYLPNKLSNLFTKIAKDELDDHFHKLLDLMDSLGYDVSDLPSPFSMTTLSMAPYRKPVVPYLPSEVIHQNIMSEEDAINHYREIARYAGTIGELKVVKVIEEILQDEVEHYEWLMQAKFEY